MKQIKTKVTFKQVFPQTHLVHNYFALSWFCHVNHSLDNIVGILVLHHGVQGAVRPILLAAHFIDQKSSLRAGRVDDTLLHDIAEILKKGRGCYCKQVNIFIAPASHWFMKSKHRKAFVLFREVLFKNKGKQQYLYL